MAIPADSTSTTLLSQLRLSIEPSIHKTNDTVSHLSRVLSRTSSLDTTLLTASYTIRFLRSALLQSSSISSRAAIPVKLPVPGYNATVLLARFVSSLGPLSALFEEVRTVLRLWSLLGIYLAAVKTYTTPQADHILQSLTWAKLASVTVFQVLENATFLTKKGVLGLNSQKVRKANLWSARAWMIYVGLELSRLAYEHRVTFANSKTLSKITSASRKSSEDQSTAVTSSHDASTSIKQTLATIEPETPPLKTLEISQKNEARQKWQHDLFTNLAYAPMTLHYSMEQPPLSETAISALGLVVAWFSMPVAWKSVL